MGQGTTRGTHPQFVSKHTPGAVHAPALQGYLADAGHEALDNHQQRTAPVILELLVHRQGAVNTGREGWRPTTKAAYGVGESKQASTA